MSNFKAWAKDVALRAVKTAAQAAVALVTANTAGLTHLDFATVADVAAMAAFVCVLQNLSNLKVPDPAAFVPLEAVFTTTTGTVVTAPPVLAQTSDAPAPDPTVPASLPGVGSGRLVGYGATSSSSSSHPPKEGPNT